MREAELLDELASFQERQNPNWDLDTRIQMCAEAVAYGKIRPEVAELAFGGQVFAQAMLLVTDLVIKSNTEIGRQHASAAATAHGLVDRIRLIPLLLTNSVRHIGRLVLPAATIAVLICLGIIAFRTAGNFLNGNGLYSGTVPNATVLTIIEPTTDVTSKEPSEKDSDLRVKIISEQLNDIVRKLGTAHAADEDRAVQDILASSEEVNESLQKLERKIRNVNPALKISHGGFNLKLARGDF